tara:strand:- start:11203 stop:11361 length:159 start_codon:yes stop_codon:yes gene_type:complete
MNINENVQKLNVYLGRRKIEIVEKLYILDLAKVSKNIDELEDNIKWENVNKI